jgi:hypothetical protein
MKNWLLMLALCAISSTFQMVITCPTCTGRITPESPPYFSDEFYQPGAESMDYLYEELLAQERDGKNQAKEGQS